MPRTLHEALLHAEKCMTLIPSLMEPEYFEEDIILLADEIWKLRDQIRNMSRNNIPRYYRND